MSRSVQQACALLDGLIGSGCRWLVLSPGSRNAPLILAAARAEAAGWVKTLVRLDERSAGFAALGLILAGVGPVALICTSGTAAANYHPAVLEAAHSALPLLVITADRPAALQRVGANQTTNQVGLFAPVVLRELFPKQTWPPEDWQLTGRQAIAAAVGARSGQAGPVHINVPLADPLVPKPGWLAATNLGPTQAVSPVSPPVSPPAQASQLLALELEFGPRTVVVAGAGAGPAARQLAEVAGWPLLAEPESGSWGGPNVISAGRLLVARHRLAKQIERLVVFGRPVLTRPITQLVQRSDLTVIGVHPGAGQWFDQGRAARVLASEVRLAGLPGPAELTWLGQWQKAGQAAWQAASCYLQSQPLSGPLVAATVAEACAGSPLLVGASSALRDLDLTPATGGPVYSLRGLAGIDGTVSAASGLALGLARPVMALLGDLTLLHDAGGLALGVLEAEFDLTLVVLNDRGGAIFEGLEVGRPDLRPVFERYMATEQAVDLAALAQAYGWGHKRVGDLGQLDQALARPPVGRRLVEVVLDRSGRANLEAQLAGLLDQPPAAG